MWQVLYLIQIAAEPGPFVALPKFVPPACEKGSGEEIVVCKPKPETARIGPRLPERTEPLLPQAGFRLGNAKVGMAGEQRGVGGFSVPAAMVSIRLPF